MMNGANAKLLSARGPTTDTEAMLLLAEELKKEEEEKQRAMQQIAELNKLRDGDRVQMAWLEKQAQVAKASERKILESLVQQTKQLQAVKSFLDVARLQARQAEQRVAGALVEMSSARGDSGRHKATLDKLQAELGKVKAEFREYKEDAEELLAAGSEKEKVLMACIKAYEEEKCRMRQEKTKLTESQRVVRDENARLREVLRQAVSEGDAIVESLADEVAHTSSFLPARSPLPLPRTRAASAFAAPAPATRELSHWSEPASRLGKCSISDEFLSFPSLDERCDIL